MQSYFNPKFPKKYVLMSNQCQSKSLSGSCTLQCRSHAKTNIVCLRPPSTRQLCCQQLSQQSCPVDVACCLPLMFGQHCCPKFNIFNFLATIFLLLVTIFSLLATGNLQHPLGNNVASNIVAVLLATTLSSGCWPLE